MWHRINISAIFVFTLGLLFLTPYPWDAAGRDLSVTFPGRYFTIPTGAHASSSPNRSSADGDFVRNLAIRRVMQVEGGYADHRQDPGGPTKYGITSSTARRYGFRRPIQTLTPDEAQTIYAALWSESGASAIESSELSIQYFDAYINHGPRARAWLHPERGRIRACLDLNQQRLIAYQRSPSWKVFRKGWIRRIEANKIACQI